MSFDCKCLSALCVCFVAAIFAGCDSAPEKVAKAKDNVEVEKSKAAEANSQDKKSAEPDAKSGSSESKDEPQAEKVIPEAGAFDVVVAKGALSFKAPGSWEKGTPKSSFVEYEISVPSRDGDDKDGRLTISRAGGSVEANINRWFGQYSQPDGGETKDVAKVTESKIGDNEVTWVDIPGTLMDKQGGPMSPGPMVERENYQMLAAIIQAGEHGQCFVKLYGPRKTISDNADAFKAFVESLKINDEAKGL